MKGKLTEVYEYYQKRVNQSDSADFNTFMGAIQDMYVHAKARRDTTDFEKLFDSLSDIESYARYWADELK